MYKKLIDELIDAAYNVGYMKACWDSGVPNTDLIDPKNKLEKAYQNLRDKLDNDRRDLIDSLHENN